MSLQVVSTILATSAAVATVLFVIGYAWRSPWRGNEVGKNTMTLMAVVAGILILTLYFRATRSVAPPWMGVMVWGALNVPLWWRTWILWKAQHRGYTVTLPPHHCTQCGEVCVGT